MTKKGKGKKFVINWSRTMLFFKEDQAILQTSTPKVLDVRFSAHSSPYRSPVFLNGLVAQYRADLEKAIGATIVSAGIDMCKFTICDKGCRTVNYANNVCLLQLTLKLTFCRFPNWLFPGRVKVKLRLSR